ncbi:MAG: alpha/beta hydrolase [Reichenbachiella sp.]
MRKTILTLLYTLLIAVTISCQSNSNNSINLYQTDKNIIYASPNGQSLTMDIYSPKTGKTNYPVLIIYHGGGWKINTKKVMDSLSMYIVEHSETVVCNVNYRLLGDQDNSVKLNETVEDALGAFLWVKENIKKYKGDPNHISLTGDSAGAHLAMMVALTTDKLDSIGFTGDHFGFTPSYVPTNQSPSSYTQEELKIDALILSYGVFDIPYYMKKGRDWENSLGIENGKQRGLFGTEINLDDNKNYYEAISPAHLIGHADSVTLPQMLFTVGSLDTTTPPESIEAFRAILTSQGHESEYWVYEGEPHAFLDSHMNDFSGKVTQFYTDGPVAADVMIAFLEKSISPDNK